MIVSDKYRYICFPDHRTASTAMATWLREHYDGMAIPAGDCEDSNHACTLSVVAGEMGQEYAETLKSYFIWETVRHPLARLASWHAIIEKNRDKPRLDKRPRPKVPWTSFGEMLDVMIEQRRNSTPWPDPKFPNVICRSPFWRRDHADDSWFFCRPTGIERHRWIVSQCSRVDRVVRYESLVEDLSAFPFVTGPVVLPVMNASGVDWKQYDREPHRAKVWELCGAEEFALGGYSNG